jgi:single-strand DNA-binding protein
MASFNHVLLVGNLTRDVELKYLQSGTAVADIGMAVNDRVKRGDEWVDEATFVDVTLFGKTAEVAGEYLGKGASVLISGRLKLDQWEKDGQKRSKLKVIGDKLQMLGGKPKNEYDQTPPQEQPRPARQESFARAPAAPPPDDSVPF